MPVLWACPVQCEAAAGVSSSSASWCSTRQNMGVLTLLKHLAPCLENSHVERYSGKTVAIDGNTFLFRGCYSCSEQVRTNQCPWVRITFQNPSGTSTSRTRNSNFLFWFWMRLWICQYGSIILICNINSRQHLRSREVTCLILKRKYCRYVLAVRRIW